MFAKDAQSHLRALDRQQNVHFIGEIDFMCQGTVWQSFNINVTQNPVNSTKLSNSPQQPPVKPKWPAPCHPRAIGRLGPQWVLCLQQC